MTLYVINAKPVTGTHTHHYLEARKICGNDGMLTSIRKALQWQLLLLK